MALISPGVEIDVQDFSTAPVASPGTIPLIVLATASNKIAANSTAIAAGTLPSNANELTLLTSQRDLLTMFGVPSFYQTSSNTPLNAYELNEYGLQTAYSVLGITNSAYVLRADIDLSQLVGTTVRPVGNPPNGAFWLDTINSSYGAFVWNATTQAFTQVTPTVLTNTTNVSGNVPIQSFGSIGSYAVVATSSTLPMFMFYKTPANTWVKVGSTAWQDSIPALLGTVTSPTLVNGNTIIINTITITLNGTTLSVLAGDINSAAIAGVTAAVINNVLAIYVDSTSQSNGSVTDGLVHITNGTGTILTGTGIVAGFYAAPLVQYSPNTSVPQWLTSDTTPRPTGSIWIKTTSFNNGALFVLNKFNATTETFAPVAAPKYANDAGADAALDPVGGGFNLANQTIYFQFNVDNTGAVSFMPYVKTATGVTTVTGTAPAPTLVAANAFSIQVSQPGSGTLTSPVTVTLTGTTVASLVTQILGLNIPNLVASSSPSAQIVFTHTAGGVIVLNPVTGSVLTTLGITTATPFVKAYPFGGSSFELSNWVPLSYTASSTAPFANPASGTNWYYSDPTAVDIMINDGTVWRGYKNVTADARGYDLSMTDPNGVLVEASAPITQSDGTSLVNGDLWINSGDLEHFPLLYRYQSGIWVQINLADSTTSNGITFADARWDTAGTTDPITGGLPPMVTFLTSDYVDLDVPLPNLFPRGTLLFNTRRSGYNVKEFQFNYFNAQSFGGSLPAMANTWVSSIGNRTNGSPYMGRKAVRALVVKAMNAAVETNGDIRSQQFFYNLISAPGYTELAQQLVALNQEIGYQAFVVEETPMRLNANGTEIINWSNSGTGTTFQDEVLGVSDAYMGVWYGCGQTTDLNGNAIIMPATYMALQGIIYSDSVSYEWFAPAGYNRGVVTNASSIGYVDSVTGNFVTNSVNKGLQDTLYTNSINPIVRFPDSGILLFGNLTRNPSGTASALGSVNIARLVSFLRFELNKLARPFLFQPNDQITRNQIATITSQLMNTLITQRAISDYLVVCDTSNNLPDTIAARELFMDVAIVPITDVEFIYIPLIIDQPGTSASVV